MGKGVSQIATAALYIGITVAAISVVIAIGAPALENMRDAAAIQKARKFMQRADNAKKQAISGGAGAAKTVDERFDRGALYFENETDALVYRLRTDAAVISPQSSRRFGNVVLNSSNESGDGDKYVRVKLIANHTLRGFKGRLTNNVEVTFRNRGLINGDLVIDVIGR